MIFVPQAHNDVYLCVVRVYFRPFSSVFRLFSPFFCPFSPFFRALFRGVIAFTITSVSSCSILFLISAPFPQVLLHSLRIHLHSLRIFISVCTYLLIRVTLSYPQTRSNFFRTSLWIFVSPPPGQPRKEVETPVFGSEKC